MLTEFQTGYIVLFLTICSLVSWFLLLAVHYAVCAVDVDWSALLALVFKENICGKSRLIS
jgi:hypothetical protein